MGFATREELLAAYAAGTTSPGLSLLCAAHVTLSPSGRALVAMAEELGGVALAEASADDVEPLRFDDMALLLDSAPTVEAPAARSAENALEDARGAGPLTRPVAEAVGGDFDAIRWRSLFANVSEHVIPGFDGERVSLLRAKPGWRSPRHTHSGDEATLVLTGEMSDGGMVYRKGDIALRGAEDDHRPEIMGDETCYCLVVADGAMRFTGRLSRALNLFRSRQ